MKHGFFAVVLFGVAAAIAQGWAQEQDTPSPDKTPPSETLSAKQKRVAVKYEQLEQLMIRMSVVEAGSHPQRAALLRRAVRQSSERLTRQQLNEVTDLLAPPTRFNRAIKDQQQVLDDMNALLKLLLSENRSDRLKNERARVTEYIKEVDRLIRLQRSLQGRTESGEDARKLAEEQEKVTERTGKLAQKIRENEEGGPSESAPQSEDTKEPDHSGEKPENAPSEKPPGPSGKPEPHTPAPGEEPPHSQEPPPREKPNDQPSPGNPAPGAPQPKPPSNAEAPHPQDQESKVENPARKRLEAAEQRMREAQQRLEKAEREEAVDEQQKARRELERAKAELEEILKQLREEEVGRMLAMLEARFRQMLEMQIRVHEATKALDKVPIEKRGRGGDIEAARLSYEEKKLVVEAEKTLLLLRDEGSSVAFAETTEQMRDDMVQVADRLAATKTGTVTQGYEEDIIAALEEMIGALRQARKDAEEKKQQEQNQPQPTSPEEIPLVSQLAEIKMIRALQMRVNKRTQRYASQLRDAEDPVGQAESDDLRFALEILAEKQQRIHRVTRDIVLGKNQ